MLRVSTNTFYRTGEQNIIDRQSELLAAQTKLSSGKRINSPSDDPLGAADATSIRASVSQFTQFKRNQDHARYLLNLNESTLASVIDSVQDIQERLVQAGNGSLTDSERRSLATDLEGTLARIVGLANSSDGAGGYLFAGSRESTMPFAQSGTRVGFAGDQILQKLEVANGRFQQVKFSGDAVFMKIRAGNGSFTTNTGAANTGAAWIDVGSVTNPASLTGRPYSINFTVAGGVTSYTVVRSNADGTTTNVAAGPYTTPQTLAFDGMQMTISGTPANGDRFEVLPGRYQSTPAATNTGVASIDSPVVVDASVLTGRPYAINFAVSGGATSYTVVRTNADGSTTNVATGAFTSPQTITFDGLRVTVSGAPANADRYDVSASPFRSLFDTVAGAIATLRAPVQANATATARFSTELGQAQASLQQALDHLLIRRSEIGTALSELDAYGSLNDNRQLEYEKRLSVVEDLDYAKGVSELARKQQTFEAALASYSKVSKLTLFDYL